MFATVARWFRARSAPCAALVCLVSIAIAAPRTINAEESAGHFDIKAQPLSEALMAFGAQTGAIVLASSTLTTGKTSRPVKGQLAAQDALTRMLLGTGLKFETTSNGAILIVRAPLSDH